MRTTSVMTRSEWRAQQLEKSYQSYLRHYNEQKSKGFTMQKVQTKGGGFVEKPLSKDSFSGIVANLKQLDKPPKNMAREIAMSQRVLSTKTAAGIEKAIKSSLEEREKQERETFAEKVSKFKSAHPDQPLPKTLKEFKPSTELEERRKTLKELSGAKGLASLDDERRGELFRTILDVRGFQEGMTSEEKTRIYREAESDMYPEKAKRRNITRR